MASILITGAAGNLGSLLSRYLAASGIRLRLMYHRTPLPADLLAAPNVQAVKADLADPSTHRVGRRRRRRHRAFRRTAVRSAARNVSSGNQHPLVFESRHGRDRREGQPGDPHVVPTGRRALVGRAVRQPAGSTRNPISVHAQTRLEEERLLFERTQGSATTPVVLRLGMVYGRGILMVEAARWLARRRLLCVWKEPTLFQLLSTADFLRATEAAIVKSACTASITSATSSR